MAISQDKTHLVNKEHKKGLLQIHILPFPCKSLKCQDQLSQNHH